jgi:hypothetical protein
MVDQTIFTSEVLSDAIKIIAPALIASLATYFASRSQLEQKIKEIKEGHAFEARIQLFSLAKEQLDGEQKEFEVISQSLHYQLGRALKELPQSSNDDALGQSSKIMAQMLVNESSSIQLEIANVREEMQSKGLLQTQYEKRLENVSKKIPLSSVPANLEELRIAISTILEVREYLCFCRKSIIKKTMDQLLARYLAQEMSTK